MNIYEVHNNLIDSATLAIPTLMTGELQLTLQYEYKSSLGIRYARPMLGMEIASSVSWLVKIQVYDKLKVQCLP